MLRLPLHRSLAVLLLAAPFAMASCVGPTEDSGGPIHDVPITLSNHSASDVTILAPGEATPCDSCRLTVTNFFRTVHLQLREGDSREFIAIFGGAVVDSVTCRWSGETSVSVDWNNGDLKCVVWAKAS